MKEEIKELWEMVEQIKYYIDRACEALCEQIDELSHLVRQLTEEKENESCGNSKRDN